MMRIRGILVSVLVLAGSAVGLAMSLTACGQQGALFLPIDPAAAGRASLPQTLRPGAGSSPPTSSSTPPSPPSPTPTPSSTPATTSKQ